MSQWKKDYGMIVQQFWGAPQLVLWTYCQNSYTTNRYTKIEPCNVTGLDWQYLQVICWVRPEKTCTCHNSCHLPLVNVLWISGSQQSELCWRQWPVLHLLVCKWQELCKTRRKIPGSCWYTDDDFQHFFRGCRKSHVYPWSDIIQVTPYCACHSKRCGYHIHTFEGVSGELSSLWYIVVS